MFFKSYRCLFHETASGRSPVEDFIKSLNEETQDKFIYKMELLEHFGRELRHPHTDSIGHGVFELRLKGKEGQIRVLFFFFHKKRIILLHGFVKRTNKTPKKEINIAEQRMQKWLKEAKKRR